MSRQSISSTYRTKTISRISTSSTDYLSRSSSTRSLLSLSTKGRKSSQSQSRSRSQAQIEYREKQQQLQRELSSKYRKSAHIYRALCARGKHNFWTNSQQNNY
mmetsp:Transcript_22258/g.25048  ORF Transcript_22258/g.25048 Transcript_22258/m.25048 type:complete len:103 (-) Transcript_22258:7-315(-)